MKEKPKQNDNHWIILAVFFSFVVIALILSQQNSKAKKTNQKFSRYERQNGPTDDENGDDNEDQDYQEFQQKGYLSKEDIQELRNWGLEASNVPDLKAKKRKGVVNTLAVDGKTGKGSCSELVIILKKSPHVSADNLDSMKVNQSKKFADTRNNNDAIIRFAAKKLIKKGHEWNYDVYVLKANSNATTVSGSSAGSGVYMALLSAFYSDAIPKNLAITGELETEKKEIPSKIETQPKKCQWRADRCAQCQKRSQLYHLIYNKNLHKLEQSFSNATDPNSQWVFCAKKCFREWWDENVYNCSKCSQQRFGSCSCCGKHYSWIGEGEDNEPFCSQECANKHYPATYEEGKIIAIGGIAGKVSAAVEKGCDTIIIPKSNSSDYHDKVPLSVQAKVKRLHEVENYEDLKNVFSLRL